MASVPRIGLETILIRLLTRSSRLCLVALPWTVLLDCPNHCFNEASIIRSVVNGDRLGMRI